MIPQMMPMYWMFMIITIIMLLMTIMNFIYFMMILPIPSNLKYNSFKIYNWSWKW